MATSYPFKPIVTDGLVLYLDAANLKSYPVTGTTWFDLSKNLHDAALLNGVLFNSNVMSFDGVNDYVLITDNIAPGAGDFTVSCWVYKTTELAIGRYIWDFGANGGTLLTGTNNGPGFMYYNSTVGLQTTPSNPIILNTWYNVVVSRISSVTKIYLDGVQISSFSDTGNIPTSLVGGLYSYFTIGNYGDGGSYNYLGYISNILVYNKGLDQVDITQNYNALKNRFII